MSRSLALRVNAGGITFTGTGSSPSYSNWNLEDDLISFAGEAEYFLPGGSVSRHLGTYLIGGLGFHSTERKVSGNFQNLGLPAASRTSTGLAYDLGLGLALNRTAALEIRFLGLGLNELRSQGRVVDAGFQGNSVVASLSVTF